MRNPFTSLCDSYRRWRHSRGYGVHSPFAYRIVTEALYPRHGYAYYLENDARLSSADPADGRRARALYRLAVVLKREYGSGPRIWLAPECPSPWRMAIRLAMGRPAASPGDAQCLVMPTQASELPDTDKLSDATKPSQSSQAPQSPRFQHSSRAGIDVAAKRGRLILAGRHWRIIITGREMADTEYSLP